MMAILDWHGVLSGQPLQWIISGFLTTVWVSVAGILLATALAVLLLALRLGGGRPGRWLVAAWVSLFRNTPLLVQLLFWYFAAGTCCRWRRAILSTTPIAGRFYRATSGG